MRKSCGVIEKEGYAIFSWALKHLIKQGKIGRFSQVSSSNYKPHVRKLEAASQMKKS